MLIPTLNGELCLQNVTGAIFLRHRGIHLLNHGWGRYRGHLPRP